jgi:antitoxin (DNA-binding transcriptional repressor) of toxin-antitoxin stability system
MLGMRELRADLATHLRRAGAGQRVVVTVGGRAVAQLGPVEPEQGQTVLADLIAAGAVVPPRRTDAARPAPAIPVWSGVRLDRALKELRG